MTYIHTMYIDTVFIYTKAYGIPHGDINTAFNSEIFIFPILTMSSSFEKG